MKEKLKKLNIRLTELSNYLNFSRPTLYKYIDDYEKRNYSKIDYNVLQVLKFINNRKTVSKLQVIDYIVNFNKETDIINDRIDEIIDTDDKREYLYKLLEIFQSKNYKILIDNFLEENIGGN